ncbi:OmpH family outer membrane protein [Dyadobacter chenwenxiniae]|uniref:OmpH family outer membrane protein n=1 Tax=Dyadobacter chenwenxiniae TaxID=2906456 RepID=A0A9X1TFH2_9BACT|nr:OmpH family outer membrane protein [Dyadobacter chenwenxiniae]MCF0062634.1 OmpH family outer membrane protein [Dyadobacter chenwenxiniae]UON83622.1 OmpH family outer membrane protein [Dyadobacter chenwenxiniae]
MNRLTKLSLFAGLIFLHFQALSQATGTVNFPKVGYTNVDLVMARMPESKAMQNQLEITKTQLEKAIDESIKEFQGKADNYQKTASQMTDIIRADKEKELENLQTRIQEMRSKAQYSLQNKQQQLMAPIQTKVKAAIQEVGRENAYVYILNMDGGEGTVPFILFASAEENNVTNLILKKLGIDPDQPEPSEKSSDISAPANPSKPQPATKNSKQ